MEIDSSTKISKLIKHNKGVIDVIANINKHFRKLKNPILCKMLASRVTIADAARIGKISVEEFMKILEEFGFSVNYSNTVKQNNNINYENKIAMNKEKLVKIDARPILNGGVDPFEEIMKILKSMSNDQTLLIINTFEPVPLLNLLKKKGYEYEVERPEQGVVYTYLHKVSGQEHREDEGKIIKEDKIVDFESVEKLFTGKMKEIDVHEMEMPMPMVTILGELEKLNSGEALYVYHKQLPQYLLPELESRGFKHVEKKIDDTNLKMIIFK